MTTKPSSFILRHSSGEFGFPCQTTFYVNHDLTVTVITLMNDMGSDGMWEVTFDGTVPIEEARTMWRTLSSYSWAPRT
jgi:hypothetical protein